MRTVEVEMTEEDIRLGIPGDHMCCPVARAIERHFDPEVIVSVFGETARIGDYVVNLPSRIGRFVCDFDANIPVQPTSFTIELPED